MKPTSARPVARLSALAGTGTVWGSRTNALLSSVLMAELASVDCSLTASTDSNQSLLLTTSVELMLEHGIPVMLMSDKDLTSDHLFKIASYVDNGHISFRLSHKN